jgi:Transglycosylase SLT domain
MKDPLSADIRLGPFLYARCLNLRNPSAKSSDKTGASETFISLMADMLDKGNNSDNPLPLDKDDLQRLISAVKIQMNEYLLNGLCDVDEDGQDAGVFKLQRKWMNDYGSVSDTASCAPTMRPEPQKAKEIIPPTEIDGIIKHASKIYGVDPELITAVIKAESDFDAGATSSKGAMGLMQLMPETARELGVKNGYNPVENVMAGTRYLKSLLNRYDGNVELTLAAYNWGMGNVESQPGRLPQETRTYIARVNGFMHKSVL